MLIYSKITTIRSNSYITRNNNFRFLPCLSSFNRYLSWFNPYLLTFNPYQTPFNPYLSSFNRYQTPFNPYLSFFNRYQTLFNPYLLSLDSDELQSYSCLFI